MVKRETILLSIGLEPRNHFKFYPMIKYVVILMCLLHFQMTVNLKMALSLSNPVVDTALYLLWFAY
nr:MAG TPA: hypothetical protein [Caudoviricetes sp.]